MRRSDRRSSARSQRPGEVAKAAAGDRSIKMLLSEEQERIFALFRPQTVSLDDLVPLGPIKVHKWKVQPEGLSEEVAVEEWIMPDGDDLVELSIKVEPDDWTNASEEFQTLLRARRIHIDGSQQAKTRSALEYFVRDGRDGSVGLDAARSSPT
jgi:hypothetical protein